MASVLSVHENLGEDKHVENILLPCLDEGSIPSWSTCKKIKRLCGTFAGMVSFLLSGREIFEKKVGVRK